MKLADVFDDLIYGELSKHGMAMTGTLSEQDKNILTKHINVALTELYTRFPLLVKELTIIQYSHITEYVLDPKYALTNKESTERYKYIYDSRFEPFTGDVIRIESVLDEIGEEVVLNSVGDCKVAFTPSPNILEIPNPIETNAMFITYRANHPKVELLTDELLLPMNLKPALLAYVAHRVYSGGTAQEHVMISNTMLQKYEMICMQQRELGMTNQDENNPNYIPCLGGWI